MKVVESILNVKHMCSSGCVEFCVKVEVVVDAVENSTVHKPTRFSHLHHMPSFFPPPLPTEVPAAGERHVRLLSSSHQVRRPAPFQLA